MDVPTQSGTIQPGARVELQWWPDGACVVAFLAGPVLATSLIMIGYRGLFGLPADLAAAARASWLIYSLGCWISVGIVWLWAKRRGLVDEIFAFRRPVGLDWIIAVAGVAAVAFVIWPFGQWVSRAFFGTGMQGMDFDLRQPQTLVLVVVWAIVTSPFCEEVLFRGLAVAFLRERRWPALAIGAASCIAFAAIHWPYFGIGGATFILFWTALVTAIRLWRNNLTPGWMVHGLNRAGPGCLNRFSASLSGASAGFRLPCGVAAG